MTRNRLLLIFLIASLIFGGAAFAQHEMGEGEPRDELDRESRIPLNVAAAGEIGFVYESYSSPQQEAEEEEDVPRLAPQQFRSTEPSTPREERPGRAHAVLEFTNDLSRAYIHVEIANIDPENIVLVHLHCGRPGQLGPIIVDFGMMGDVSEFLADGTMSLEIRNADLEAVIENGAGFVGAFTAGCPIVPTIPNDRFRTIAGLEYVARQGELYFNLHTAGQTFYGDVRGTFYLVEME